MTSRLRAFLELTRPANVVTACADVLAGFTAAGTARAILQHEQALGFEAVSLLVATVGLYAGGVVLNDVFDAPVDALERPERPIPSGRVTRTDAAALGTMLLAGGVAVAAVAGRASLLVAALIAACVLLYNGLAKGHAVLGPLTMGACRGGNLMLGVSVAPAMLLDVWYIALIPVAYIGAVTAVSRGEVHGGSRSSGVLALVLVTGVAGALVLLGMRLDYRTLRSLPFLAVFIALVFPPFLRAALLPRPERLRKAVKAGVLALVAMDATLAAGFGGWPAGLVVLGLLPVSIGIARLFAVT